MTSFIGRDSEVAEIKEALRGHGLVTLTGVGGVGKTRPAMEVATQVSAEFPDGVWLFELAAVSDPSAVPDAVAAIFGISPQPGKTVTESVAVALEDRSPPAGIRQLRACPRRRGRSGRSDPCAVRDGEGSGHQPRRTRGRRRTGMACAIVGRRHGCRPLRRARSQCLAGLFGRQDGHGNLQPSRRHPTGC